ncbi:MAG TPA: hypothetical protein VKU01_36520 [Bryobacteraceae bacterium]|nr:hypothetical protein [Bryobacteraceae bacterium]
MRCIAVCLAAACVCAAASAPDNPILDRIKARVAENLLSLPNYTCAESVTRLQRRKSSRHFELLDRLHLEVAFVEGKEMFGWRGAKRISETDPRRLVSGSGALANGSFGLFAKGVFLTPDVEFSYQGAAVQGGVKCERFSYRVPASASGYHLHVDPNDAVVGYHGSLWANAETYDLIRLEVHADEIPDELGLSSANHDLEYAPVDIGGSSFVLPRSSELMLAESSGFESRNETRFDTCRQYSGASSLSFVIPDEKVAPAPPVPVPEIELPADFDMDVALVTRITGDSAVGDAVTARLVKKTKFLAKGAILTGYITRLHRDDGSYHVGIAFTDVDSSAGHATLEGRQNALFANLGLREFRWQLGFRKNGPSDYGTLNIPGSKLNLKPGFHMLIRSRAAESTD